QLENVGYSLGLEAMGQAVEHAAQVCALERQKRETLNASELARVRLRLDALNERRKALVEQSRLALPDDLEALHRRRFYLRAIAVLFAAAGVGFAYLTIAPFGLGRLALPLSLAIGIAAPFWVDRVLQKYDSERLIRTGCLVGLVTGLVGVFIMSILRGDILALYLRGALASGRL